MTDTASHHAAKVPAVTLGFWIVKIVATTLGETGGDTLSMTLDWGYLAATALFAAILAALVWAQVAAARFRPWLYWATIIASTTAGTTLADFATRSLGIGYAGGSLLLLGGVIACLAAWRVMLGTVSVASVDNARAELFYWLTITFSQTLGTALGDWTADAPGIGYLGAAAIFGTALAVLAILYFRMAVNRVALFWAAFVLTRPLGATLGDFFDKPHDKGGLDVSRPVASAVLATAIVVLIVVLPQRAAGRAGLMRGL